MDTSNLDDLLHKAEQLTAIIDGNIEMPRIERNLKQLLDAGDQMYARTVGSSAKDVNDVRASVLLGSKGFDLQKVTQHLNTLSSFKKTVQIEAESDSDIKGFLKKEYENAIIKNIDTVRTSTIEDSDKFYSSYIQKEWEDQKNKILNALVGPDEINEMSFDLSAKSPSITSPSQSKSKLYYDKTFIDKSAISAMNASEMAFAKEVIKYVDQVVNTPIKSDLAQAFYNVAKDIIGENSINDLWTMVHTLVSNEIPSINETDPLARRNNYILNKYFINKSCKYLEDKFIQSMQSMVNAPIGQSLTSDVIYNLVKDYLNIKTPYYVNASRNPVFPSKDYGEDGLVDGIPVWCFIFYCLRAGSVDSAIAVAQKLSNQTQRNEISKILREYKLSNDGYLNRSTEEMLKLQYNKTVRLSNDIFKKSVYSIFARCAPKEFYNEIFDKIDDFLWIKLKKVSVNKADNENTLILRTSDLFTLSKLKQEIVEELEEEYAKDQPFLYFRALFLTLQWETAIEFLFRFDAYRCYALHIALALHEHNLIIISDHVKLSILSRAANDPPEVQRLNLAKLINVYTKKFELANTVDVIYYYYFLHKLSLPTGESLFITYISQLVRETKNYHLLLGSINTDGVRVLGAIDKFNQDVGSVIKQVASDLENDGLFEDAVRLYDLANNHTKVLSLLNRMLSPLIANQKNGDPKREKIENFAIQIAERFVYILRFFSILTTLSLPADIVIKSVMPQERLPPLSIF